MESPKAHNLKTLHLNIDKSTLIERKLKAIEERSARCAEIRSKFKYNLPFETKSTSRMIEPHKETKKEAAAKKASGAK